MRSIVLMFACLMVMLLSISGIAQSTLFYLMPPSVLIDGYASAGVAVPEEDPMGMFYNPAHLGHLSRFTNVATQFYQHKLWPQITDDLKVTARAFGAAYHLQKKFPALPLRVGIGYLKVRLDYEEKTASIILGNEIHRFKPYDAYDAYGLGLSYDRTVSVSAGVALKKYDSKLDSYSGAGPQMSKGHLWDLGVQFRFPLIKLPENEKGLASRQFIPTADIYLGYAIVNLGDTMIYKVNGTIIDKMLFPRTSRMGYGIDVSLHSFVSGKPLVFLTMRGAIEAENRLWDYQNGKESYLGIFGKMHVWKNFFLGKHSDFTAGKRGLSIMALECLRVSTGRLAYWDEPRITHSSGWGIFSRGLFKMARALAPHPALDFLARHVNLAYLKLNLDIEDMSNSYDSFLISINLFE